MECNSTVLEQDSSWQKTKRMNLSKKPAYMGFGAWQVSSNLVSTTYNCVTLKTFFTLSEKLFLLHLENEDNPTQLEH